MGLFRITKTGVLLDSDCKKLCKVLNKLSQKEFHALILWLDYDSKFKMYPSVEMRRKACLEVFGDSKYNLELNPLMPAAIEEYNSLQYDIRRETIKVYQTKIATCQQDLLNEESTKKTLDLMGIIRGLTSEIKDIQRQIDSDESAVSIRGGGSISFIEQYQLNQVQYNRDQERLRKNQNLKARSRAVDGPL